MLSSFLSVTSFMWGTGSPGFNRDHLQIQKGPVGSKGTSTSNRIRTNKDCSTKRERHCGKTRGPGTTSLLDSREGSSRLVVIVRA